jgi:predicted metal-binding membrane protein
MVAMMFPATASMALTFHRLRDVTRPFENAFVSTWVFVSAYLLVWAIAGLAAYAALLTARYGLLPSPRIVRKYYSRRLHKALPT